MESKMKHPHHEAELNAPDELRNDLSALYEPGVSVPPEVDQSIIRMARERLAVRGKPRLSLRWAWAGTAATATVILLAVFALRTPKRDLGAPVNRPPAVMKEDFDGDGRVNILDAFALARQIESSGEPDRKWDVNGDGTVDRADVDRLAMAAVSLKRGT